MPKIRLGLLFGGRSVEHEVSIASATSIHKALDPARYDVTLLAVDREGRWHRGRPELPPEASVDGEVVILPVAAGEHTRDALAAWGLGGDEIDALIASGVVAQRSASD